MPASPLAGLEVLRIQLLKTLSNLNSVAIHRFGKEVKLITTTYKVLGYAVANVNVDSYVDRV